MPLKITVDIFSGSENPIIKLTERGFLKVLEQLKPMRKIKEKGKTFLLSQRYVTVD